MIEVDVKYLRAALRYDEETGTIWWRHRDDCPRKWNTRYAHTQAFNTLHGRGYLIGAINGRLFPSHRIVWAMHYGKWPDGEIDHINGVKTDNRIGNLRTATRSENEWNKGKQTNNTSGLKGVSFCKRTGRWQAQIQHKGKQIHLGRFTTPEDAHAAYCEASKKYHGEYSRTE